MDNITPEGFGREDNRPKDGWTGSEKGGGGFRDGFRHVIYYPDKLGDTK